MAEATTQADSMAIVHVTSARNPDRAGCRRCASVEVYRVKAIGMLPVAKARMSRRSRSPARKRLALSRVGSWMPLNRHLLHFVFTGSIPGTGQAALDFVSNDAKSQSGGNAGPHGHPERTQAILASASEIKTTTARRFWRARMTRLWQWKNACHERGAQKDRGADSLTRTDDLPLTRRLLYQLSYAGTSRIVARNTGSAARAAPRHRRRASRASRPDARGRRRSRASTPAAPRCVRSIAD